MKTIKILLPVLLAAITLGGCARAAKDTTGFAIKDETTVSAPADVAWQAAKSVLRDMELDIYTRDKRGLLVAYTPMKRKLLVPHRTEYTITIVEETPSASRVSIETVNQVYGVTLLTYPNWHDRKATDNSRALAILDGIKAKLAAG